MATAEEWLAFLGPDPDAQLHRDEQAAAQAGDTTAEDYYLRLRAERRTA